MQLGRQGVGDLVRSPSSCSAPPPLVFVQALTVDISESSNLQSPGGLHTALAAIIPETKRDRQADYLGLYFFSWEQRKALNELAAREGLTGQSPKCPVLLPLRGTPFLIPRAVLSLPALLQRRGEVLPRGRAPLGLPCSTLGVSGRAAPGAGVAGNKLTLTPTLCPSSLYLVVTFPGWSGDGLAWPHPAWLRVSSPCQGLHPIQTGPTPRHSEGQVPSIWCPWPAPSAGAGALVETTQNPIVGARRASLPGQGPAPAPALPGKWLSLAGHGHIPLRVPCSGCSPCSRCPPAVPSTRALPGSPAAGSPAGWVVSPGR